MEQANLFVQASRQAYRFSSPQGMLTIEQLWTLPLQSKIGHQATLDNVAKAVNAELKTITEESFVSAPSPRRPELEAKLEIVKFIIATKQAENAAKVEKVAAASEASKLEAILETKEASELQNLSADEIRARLAAAKAKANA